MFNSETIKELTLEVLKSKCDLQNSTEEEILKSYFNIYINLQNVNKTLTSDNKLEFLK